MRLTSHKFASYVGFVCFSSLKSIFEFMLQLYTKAGP